MPAQLSQFAELCQRLAETGSKLQKRALMAEYLRALPVPEAGLAETVEQSQPGAFAIWSKRIRPSSEAI